MKGRRCWTAVLAFLFLPCGSSPVAAQVWPVGAVGQIDLAPSEMVGWGAVTVDLDSDGVLDVVYSARNGGAGQVHFTHGTGRGLVHLGSISGPADALCGRALAAGDFASDPNVVRPHIVMGCDGNNSTAGSVRIYRVRANDGAIVLVGELEMGVDGLPGSPGAHNLFGAALAVGDFNGDTVDDLAVGAPWTDLGAPVLADVGAVIVIYGGFSGLDPASGEQWSQSSPGVPGVNEMNDNFGSALAAGDFDGDGFDDLAIGAPQEMESGLQYVGSVTVLRGSASGLTNAGAQALLQGDGIVPGAQEAGDAFGSVLAAGRIVSDDGVGGPAADEADLVIGDPDEDISTTNAAGVVFILVGRDGGFTSAGARVLSQAGLSGESPEAGDHFGFALAVGDFSHDGWDDLAVGVPNEGVGPVVWHGAAHLIFGDRVAIDTAKAQLVIPDGAFPYAPLGENDLFGLTLAAGDLDGDGHSDLITGAPLWDYRFSDPDIVDAGNLVILYGGMFADGFNAGQTSAWSSVAP